MTMPKGERGAIAVMVVVLMVALLAVAAFATDLGYAYAVKRKLSVTVDAAALAAAAAVSKALPPGAACDGQALQPIAQATATSYVRQNDSNPSVTVTVPNPQCVSATASEGASVRVTVQANQTTPSFFGGIAGIRSFTPSRTATAELFVPNTYVGLRPIAACQTAVVQGLPPTGGQPVQPFVVYVSKDNGICGSVSTGNWGLLNFLDQGANGSFNEAGTPAYYTGEGCAGGSTKSGGNDPCQQEWIDSGYQGPVVIPNRTSNPGPGLADNTGLATADYAGLVGKIIQIPVATKYDSSQKTMDVVGVVTARVCAVKVKKSAPVVVDPQDLSECTYTDSATPPTAHTYTAPPDTAPWNVPYGGDPSNNDYDNWLGNGINLSNTVMLWLFPTDYTVSGTINGPGSCSITSPTCDYGTRAVRLFH